MSPCWHFSFSIFFQYLSVQSEEFGWVLDLLRRGLPSCFSFFFLGYLVTCFGHWNDWIFLGFSSFSFSFGVLVDSHKRCLHFGVEEGTVRLGIRLH